MHHIDAHNVDGELVSSISYQRASNRDVAFKCSKMQRSKALLGSLRVDVLGEDLARKSFHTVLKDTFGELGLI